MDFVYLLILAVISRLVPHPANFAAVGGLTIFSAKRYSIWFALALLICAMVITDIFLGFGKTTFWVYLGMLGYVFASRLISNKASYFYAPIIGSVFFFLVSNFGVWIEGWYPMTFAGLMTCYIAAIPFFQNTLISDLVFCLGAFAFVAIYEKYKYRGGILWRRKLPKPILMKK